MQKQSAPADDGFFQTIRSSDFDTSRHRARSRPEKNKNGVRPIGDGDSGGCLRRLSTPVAVRFSCFCYHPLLVLPLSTFQPQRRIMFRSILFWTIRLLSRLRLVARVRARLRARSTSKCNPERDLLSPSEAALYRRCLFTLLGIFTMYLLHLIFQP